MADAGLSAGTAVQTDMDVHIFPRTCAPIHAPVAVLHMLK